MKICVIHNIVAPYRIPIFNELSKIEGVDLHVLFLAKSEPLRNWKMYQDEMLFKYKILKSLVMRTKQYAIFITPSIIKEISNLKPAIVFCGSYENPSAWLALLTCKKKGIPFVGWVDSTIKSQTPATFIRGVIKKWFFANCTAFLAHGKASKEFIEKTFNVNPEKVFISPHTVDNDYFKEKSAFFHVEKEKFKTEKGYPRKLILYVGSFERRKAVMDLLKAYILIKDKDDKGVIIAGAGGDDAYENECVKFCEKNGINKHVFFEGFVHREDLPSYYAISDIFVFPTHSDVWGLVINEAMACGLPIISSDAAGATEDLVFNGKNGFIYPNGNIEQLANCIDKMLSDGQSRAVMGKESLNIISGLTPKKSAYGFLLAAKSILKT